MAHDDNHDRISELLGPYERGELGDADATMVGRHLEGCSDCRAEHAALRVLLSSDVEPLSAADRARLHEAVAERVDIGAGARGADVYSLPRRGVVARVAPALAAAAVIAVAIVGVGKLTDRAPQGAGDAASRGAAQDSFAGPPPVFERADAVLSDTQAAGTAAEAGGQGPADPSPATEKAQVWRSTARYTRGRDFTRAERRHPVFGRFVAAYDLADADALGPTFLEALAESAPDEATRAQIRECGRSVFEGSPTPVLPAYGAVRARGRKDILVLGFVWTPVGTGRVLDQYMLWMWPLGGGCEIPLGYEADAVR